MRAAPTPGAGPYLHLEPSHPAGSEAMPSEPGTPNPKSAIRRYGQPVEGRNPPFNWLSWLARGLFVAAVLAAGYGMWLKRAATPSGHPAAAEAQALRKSPIAIDWPREEFLSWSSAEDGIEIRYPARFDAVRGFGRFTSRDVEGGIEEGGIEETDVVSFRSSEPRAVIVVAAYRAARPLTWEEWTSLAKENPPPQPPDPDPQTPDPRPQIGRQLPPSPFALEFGGSDREFRETRAGERPALAVSARGAVKYPIRGNEQWELWRFESRLVAEGDAAVRVTAGVHHDHYEGAREGLERALESFRWRR
jgi:hypothetical protein